MQILSGNMYVCLFVCMYITVLNWNKRINLHKMIVHHLTKRWPLKHSTPITICTFTEGDFFSQVLMQFPINARQYMSKEKVKKEPHSIDERLICHMSASLNPPLPWDLSSTVSTQPASLFPNNPLFYDLALNYIKQMTKIHMFKWSVVCNQKWCTSLYYHCKT